MTAIHPTPETTPYELLGGDAAVRALVERFYTLMDSEPAFAGIRAMHPESLAGSTDKLYWFLSGWLGGPSMYAERVGPPMLRARHLPFPIATAERDQWVACMDRAMKDCGVGFGLRTALHESFFKTADWMRNKQG